MKNTFINEDDKKKDEIIRLDLERQDDAEEVLVDMDNLGSKTVENVEVDEEAGDVDNAEVYSTTYDRNRFKEYGGTMAEATVGEVAAAMGEAYYEVKNKRRMDDEQMFFLNGVGMKKHDMSTVSEKFPGFYIALGLMALEAVAKSGYKLEKEQNFRWGDASSIKHRVFNIGLNKDVKLKTASFQILEREETDQKMVLEYAIEPSVNGEFLAINIYTKPDETYLADNLLKDMKEWIKENNYFKGQKIDANGKFLNVSKYSWDDIIIDAEKKNLVFDDVVGFLNHAEAYKKNGLPFKRGLILYGMPGCGKTLLGKVIANEIDTAFIWITSAQASSAGFIRQIFSLAREISPAVLFFEDIDMYTIGRHYGNFSPLVGEMLAQMDGMEENDGLIVVATTNRIDMIEGALAKRPSRFDRKVSLDDMKQETVIKMVETKLGNAQLDGITVEEVAKYVDGLNGSFIQEVVISAKRKAVTLQSFNEDGYVILTKEVILNSIMELAKAFHLMLKDVKSGNYEDYVRSEDDDSVVAERYSLDNRMTLTQKAEDCINLVLKDASKEPKLEAQPVNVSLTEKDKKGIDAEVATARKAYVDKVEGVDLETIKQYEDDTLLKEFIAERAGVAVENINWTMQSKDTLRQIFRRIVISRNIRTMTGKKANPIKVIKFVDMLHAMDMKSDRYYWANALVRIDKEFGRKVYVPFNLYEDQTTNKGAKDLFNSIIKGKNPKKNKEDDANKGLAKAEKIPQVDVPAYNTPENPKNVAKPNVD